jgi:hypothetical protein
LYSSSEISVRGRVHSAFAEIDRFPLDGTAFIFFFVILVFGFDRLLLHLHRDTPM